MERNPHPPQTPWKKSLLPVALLLAAMLACRRPSNTPVTAPPVPQAIPTVQPTEIVAEASLTYLPIIRQAEDITIETPTPDAPHPLPPLRSEAELYTVLAGDSLREIARRYGVTVVAIATANNLLNPDLLQVGQQLVIPAPQPGAPGLAFKIIPDSELVYGPYAEMTDIGAFIDRYASYLARFEEEVNGEWLDGAQIVERVARENSVNPRLLLAVLEYQSGWVTLANPEQSTRDFPMGMPDAWRKGLYLQLSWAANNLDRGFYLWRVGGVGAWVLTDGSLVPIDPTINAGTAGVQYLFSLLRDRQGWERAVSETGVAATFNSFFGYAFDYTFEPLVPADLTQPEFRLPFEDGVAWAFTGGPHGGWGDGSAWAALDFAPNLHSCMPSLEWVTAVADGLILRADNGEVVQDLDGDGLEGTGWTVLYLHIDSSQRVQAGTVLQAGDRIGHVSCEGGYSTATHLHLARRYNGEWIPADQNLPFNLDGWVSSSAGIEYDGYLERNGETLEAWEGFFPENTLTRP